MFRTQSLLIVAMLMTSASIRRTHHLKVRPSFRRDQSRAYRPARHPLQPSSPWHRAKRSKSRRGYRSRRGESGQTASSA